MINIISNADIVHFILVRLKELSQYIREQKFNYLCAEKRNVSAQDQQRKI